MEFINFLRDKHPDLFQEAIQSLIQVLQEGRLQPVCLQAKDRVRLQALEEEKEQARQALPFNKMSEEELQALQDGDRQKDIFDDDQEVDDKWHSLSDQVEQLTKQLYNKGCTDQEKLISQLQGWLEGSLSEDESDIFLGYSFCSGESLYKTDLPEWIKWIDNYHLGYDYPDDQGVAILLDPESSQLDERGYYKGYKRKSLSKLEDQEEIATAFQIGIAKTMEELKAFLAFQSIIDVVSKALDTDFSGEVQVWYEDVLDTVEEYNNSVEKANDYNSSLMQSKVKKSLRKLHISRLKPTKKTLKHLEERMSLTLGYSWWNEARAILLEDLMEKEAQDG